MNKLTFQCHPTSWPCCLHYRKKKPHPPDRRCLYLVTCTGSSSEGTGTLIQHLHPDTRTCTSSRLHGHRSLSPRHRQGCRYSWCILDCCLNHALRACGIVPAVRGRQTKRWCLDKSSSNQSP